ncbi:MAG: hypothetical protein HOF38_05240 [Elusimicrobiaceae bacterium]|jgi:hypothetical protein|nr:hypothetical protein [Elusimicrobiaceae bacterium]MBT4008167.1 hypothetical protein [Elusimicrobiaceae bacterium]MBT4402533.1 hypothetical protein [Elusimicrobiaceae bacterium]MBT4439660.1 hypothetical protein [Elusimicrobiaceae bacterium]MBT5988046.1 hypothetical protein [Elusimicrobiaceae bacterium]
MKNFLTLIFLTCPMFLYSASSVSMTTYYPVPAAIYSEVQAETSSLASEDGSFLQIGSSSNTASLEVASEAFFEETLTIGDSDHSIYTEMSKDLNVNPLNSVGNYSFLVESSNLDVTGTTSFTGAVVTANANTEVRFNNSLAVNGTTTVTNNTYVFSDINISALLTINGTSTISSFAFRTSDAQSSYYEYADLPQFPDVLEDADCNGSGDPNMIWHLWEYVDENGVDQDMYVLALDKLCPS